MAETGGDSGTAASCSGSTFPNRVILVVVVVAVVVVGYALDCT